MIDYINLERFKLFCLITSTSLLVAVFRQIQRNQLVVIFWHMPPRRALHYGKAEENYELQRFMTGS
jgi:hypothetical protein